MSEMKEIQHVKPLNPRIAFSHDHEWSVYPDTIRIPMSDGHVETYVRMVEQPHPQCLKAIDLIRVMNDTTYGGYQAKHEKK